MDPSDRRRDATYFLAGPALVAILAAIAFRLSPWPVAIASQAQILQPIPVAVILLAGCLGAALSSRAGLPSAPPLRDGRRWGRLTLETVGAGLAFGAALFAIDAAFHLTAGAAKALGANWVNVALPASLPHYAAAAVLLECVYRIAPLSVLGWLFGRVLFKSHAGAVFWTLAVLTSLIEPASQMALARPGALAAIGGLVVLTFAANLFEAVEMRRHGWPAPIAFRLAFYAVWHCFGPYLTAPASVLYPGPH